MTATAPRTTTTTPRIVQPDLASAAFKANPHPFYAQLRAEAPVFRATLGGKRSAWLVTCYDDALAVLKDERYVKDPRNATPPGAKSPGSWLPPMFQLLRSNLTDIDAPDHTRLRALVHKAFTPRLIAQLRGRIQTLTDSYLDAAERKGPKGHLELVAGLAVPLPVAVISEMLGVPEANRTALREHVHAMVSLNPGEPKGLLRVVPHIWLLLRDLRTLVRQKRAHPGDDLTTALVQAEEAGDRLSEDELVAMLVLLFSAGHETTVNLIASGTLALLQHPEQLALLHHEPERTKTAVEELLRYVTPVDIATERYAREQTILGGETIRQGEQVLVVLGSANRDASQFAHPDVLDVTREPNRHLALGQGIHYCLGAPLARLEGQIAIESLLRRYPNLRLAAEPDSLRWRRNLFLRGLEQLPLAY